MRHTSPHGFTLIELLVVVTIIVILVALMAPALEKSIYEAGVAVCASRLKGVGTISFTYASDNRRFYPSRPDNYAFDAVIFREPRTNSYPTRDGGQAVPYDLRPKFEPYGSLELFVDPLSGLIKLDSASNPDTGAGQDFTNRGRVLIYSNFQVYTGWGVNGYKQMRRLGDAFEFTDTLSSPTGAHYRFPIIAADREETGWWGGWSVSSHNDHAGTFRFRRFQAEEAAEPDIYTPVLGQKVARTESYWETNDGRTKDVDSSYAYTDGSVRTFRHVKMDDPRMAKIVMTTPTDYNTSNRYAQAPKSGG